MLIRSDDDEGGPGGSWMGHRRGDPERAATHLRNVLQLTPAQEPALQAYLAALHPPHEGYRHEGPGGAPGLQGGPPPADPAARRAAMDQRRAEMDKRRAEQAALTTPERLDRMIKTMTERAAKRQAQMQAHVAAIKQFYAALTPAQQKAFDALGGARKGGMGYGRGRWIHMGMMDPIGAPLPPSPPIPPLAMWAPMPPAPPPPY